MQLNLNYLSEISGGDKNFIREMLELYVQSTAPEAENFQALLENANYEGIGHLAHKIKAPVQMLGADDLFHHLKTLEKYGKEGSNLNEIPGLVARVQVLVKESIEAAQESLKGL